MKKINIVLAVFLSLIMANGIVYSVGSKKKCSDCEGKGQITTEYDCGACADGKVKCHHCYGEGKVECGHCGGTAEVKVRCGDCSGTGKDDGKECRKCSGDGEVSVKCINCKEGYNTCTACDGGGEEDCSFCGGLGYKTTTASCGKCGGTGEIED